MTKEEERLYHDTFVALYPSLLRYCLIKLNNNRSQAQEICQDAFLILMDRGHDFPNQDAMRAYLFRTARHLIARFLRKRQREQERLTSLDNMPPGLESENLSYQVDFEYWLGLKVPIKEAKWEILDSLSAEEQDLYIWYFIEKQTAEEIAQRLNIHPNAVHQRLHRLRKCIMGRIEKLKLI